MTIIHKLQLQALLTLRLPPHLVHLRQLWRSESTRCNRGDIFPTLHRCFSSIACFHCQGLVERRKGGLADIFGVSNLSISGVSEVRQLG